MANRKFRHIFMGVSSLALIAGGGVGLFFAIQKYQDAIREDELLPPALPTETIETTTLTPQILNDGVSRSTINRHHVPQPTDWKTHQEYIVMLGNNPNPNMISKEEAATNEYLDPGEKIHADIYETEMFRYAVDMNTYFGRNKLQHRDIEAIVEKFEQNVNYGIGAHTYLINSSYAYVNKPIIEFLQSDHIFSWGGAQGAEISLPRAPHRSRSYDDDVLQYAALVLHEYGHHETIVSTRVLVDNEGSKPFTKMHDAFQANPHLAPFIRYWWDNGDASEDDARDYRTSSDYDTIYGRIGHGEQYFGPSGYSMSAAEWATRYEMFMETGAKLENGVWEGITAPQIFKNVQWRADIAAFYESFAEKNSAGLVTRVHSPFESTGTIHTAQEVNEIYKDDVYGFNHYASTGTLAHFVNGQTIDKVEIELSPEKAMYFTYMQGANGERQRTKETTVNAVRHLGLNSDANTLNPNATASITLSGADLISDPTDFRFNTRYSNNTIEEEISGNAYSMDLTHVNTRKKAVNTLLTSELKGIFHAKIKYYKGNTLVKTLNT